MVNPEMYDLEKQKNATQHSQETALPCGARGSYCNSHFQIEIEIQ